jgi:PadR family transcriptional regulator PadR
MDSEFVSNWMTQARKGLLELGILRVVRSGRVYGYDIVRTLRAVDALVISEGTVYPILSRFKREGLVTHSIEESQEGPPRKYYTLTDRGRELLEQMDSHWDKVKRGVDSLGNGDQS